MQEVTEILVRNGGRTVVYWQCNTVTQMSLLIAVKTVQASIRRC